MNTVTKHISPWFWVPSLYLVEGVPYFLVNSISVTMFTKMGITNGELSFFTTLLYFPWFLKGLWSPIIDVVRTKRWWIISMQVFLTLLCILVTITLPKPDITTIIYKETSVSIFWFTLVLFIIAAFASATHDIAADGYYMLAHDQDSQSRFIGIRSTFYRIASVFCQRALVLIAGTIEKNTPLVVLEEATNKIVDIDPAMVRGTEGYTVIGDIPLSWQITLGFTSIVMFAITLYHIFYLPTSKLDKPRAIEGNISDSFGELFRSFKTFFTKKGIGMAIVFMLLYRLSEGFLVKLCQPFLLDERAIRITSNGILGGGLGLSTDIVGLLNGTIGVICLLIGGIFGGLYTSHYGLRKSLWIMALSLTLPSFVYVILSIYQPTSICFIGACIGFEQLGYGFGFTAYMLYMIHISDGEYKTSHYAICTAFMALSAMLPGFVAGWIEMQIGYTAYFWLANSCSITTFIVTYFVHRKLTE